MASIANASPDGAVSWYTANAAAINRCGIPAGAIASVAFQDDPAPLDIAWVRQEHAGLLAALARIADAEERADLFHHYTLTRPWAHEDPAVWPDRRRRSGYAAVLRGWGVDSNGASGAVLKGWAESRFGLRPIWHRTALSDHDAQERYASERQRGGIGAIGMQLDLLYTYVQDELLRRHPGRRHLTLWRGSHDAELYEVKPVSAEHGAGPHRLPMGRAPSSGGGMASAQPMPPLFPRLPDETELRQSPGAGVEVRRGAAHEQIVEYNVVSSFTTDREVAWEFGSRVWEVEVPLAKIVLHPGMLPAGLLGGECECIVLGGDYRVRDLAH